MRYLLDTCPVCGKAHAANAAGALRISIVVQGKPADALTSDTIPVSPIARKCLPGAVLLVREHLIPGLLEMLGAEEEGQE